MASALVEIDDRIDLTCVTTYSGVPSVIELFTDGSVVKHFAIAINRKGDGLPLIRWHREKAGTVEHVHHVLKNKLAATALPSGKFGANAARFRLNGLIDNLLSVLKRLALPGDLSKARPTRLRFLVFNTVGKVVQHARRTLLRFTPLRSRPSWPSHAAIS